MFVVSISFSCFILLESRARWGEISIWVFGQWFEAMSLAAKKNKYYVNIPGLSLDLMQRFSWILPLQKITLAAAMGIVAICYYDEGQISKKFNFLLNQILGERNLFGPTATAKSFGEKADTEQ